MNTKNSISAAHEFIWEVFSDCDGAMLVQSKKEGILEIMVFYNLIHAHYQKDFHYHSWEISITTYRTGNCYALFFPVGKHHKRVRMFSDGTIIKDNKHELEIMQSEAKIMLERDQIYR